MKTIKLIALLFAMTTLFVACDDDDQKGAPSTDKKYDELLVANSWRLFTHIGPNGGDMLKDKPICEMDNLFKYSANNTYVLDEGGSKCHQLDPQVIEQGTWQVIDGVIIRTPKDGGNRALADLKIEELTSTKLVYSHTYVDQGVSKTERYTFVAAN